ncbi:unnamed protein product, partial [Rotaria magnacalcarata]
MREQNSTGHPNAFLTQSIPSYHENDPEGGYRGTGFSVKFNTKTDGSISRNRSRFDDQHLEQEGNESTKRKVLRSHQPSNLALSNG